MNIAFMIACYMWLFLDQKFCCWRTQTQKLQRIKDESWTKINVVCKRSKWDDILEMWWVNIPQIKQTKATMNCINHCNIECLTNSLTFHVFFFFILSTYSSVFFLLVFLITIFHGHEKSHRGQEYKEMRNQRREREREREKSGWVFAEGEKQCF